jgi:hypothetical protein
VLPFGFSSLSVDFGSALLADADHAAGGLAVVADSLFNFVGNAGGFAALGANQHHVAGVDGHILVDDAAGLLGVAGFVSHTDPATGQTIINISDMESVQTMIWALFSLFPAAIALLIVLLLRLYPIKK